MTDTSISSLNLAAANILSLGGVRPGRLPVLRSCAAGQREREFAGACVWPKAQSLAGTGSRRGAKRGASERRYQAMPGDVQRLALLAEPHPATLRDGKDLYGRPSRPGQRGTALSSRALVPMVVRGRNRLVRASRVGRSSPRLCQRQPPQLGHHTGQDRPSWTVPSPCDGGRSGRKARVTDVYADVSTYVTLILLRRRHDAALRSKWISGRGRRR
jgi:hypothetical protein